MTRIRLARKRTLSVKVAFRGAVLIGLIALIITTIGIVASISSTHSDPIAIARNLTPDPELTPAEAAYLAIILNVGSNDLTRPAGSETAFQEFDVKPGETANDIAASLRALKFITDAGLFKSYLRYYGLDRQIEAGAHQLSQRMTIPEIAVALTVAAPPEIVVRIPEGWRREQYAGWIDQQTDLPFKGQDFLDATGAQLLLPDEVGLVREIPSGGSLEGFLFPDTYRLKVDASASDLAKKALENFNIRVAAELRSDMAASGLTLYQVVTLASIVEREAVISDERPIIASVYLNRLNIGMNLEADPTVQYAMGFQAASGQWWNLNLTQADYHTVDSPYNTYIYPGLPPGPIANPSLASIEAVVHPASTPYLFFRATCDGSGRHQFATSYDEHVNNECP